MAKAWLDEGVFPPHTLHGEHSIYNCPEADGMHLFVGISLVSCWLCGKHHTACIVCGAYQSPHRGTSSLVS